MKRKSCLFTLLVFLDNIFSRADEGEPPDVLHLGFQKILNKDTNVKK